MSFILSSSTEVGFGSFSKTRGIISVQVNTIPQNQRLPVLGSSLPFSEVKLVQNQVSLTRYGGGPVYNVEPSLTCKDSNTIKFKFLPISCGDSVFSLQGEFFVNSYSFSKEINQLGIESWGLIDKPVVVFSRGAKFGSQNKVVVRGISEAQTTPGLNTGVTLSPLGQSSGVTASVSAGNPGVGRADTTILGVAITVGGSTTSKGSEEGRAQVQIPYQVIDI